MNTVESTPIVSRSADSGVMVPSCRSQGWKAQFGHPRGVVGWLIGHLMVIKNRRMNDLAVELLDIQPDDRILEIGFGPGQSIQAMARRVPRGIVAGIDPSEVMLRQARRRNRPFVESERVDLHRASVSEIPFDNETFNKVVATNSLHHWPDPMSGLREIRRVLRDSGMLVLCLRLAQPSRTALAAPGFTSAEVDAIRRRLTQAGFARTRSITRRLGREILVLLAYPNGYANASDAPKAGGRT